jgi:hypothetical protein
LQLASPHTGGQTPQSVGQLEQLSVPLQLASPQTGGHTPQSAGQVEQVSPVWQTPLPHTGGQTPQSAGQVAQVSPGWQKWLPQLLGEASSVASGKFAWAIPTIPNRTRSLTSGSVCAYSRTGIESTTPATVIWIILRKFI